MEVERDLPAVRPWAFDGIRCFNLATITIEYAFFPPQSMGGAYMESDTGEVRG
jgi:hypothetical protein